MTATTAASQGDSSPDPKTKSSLLLAAAAAVAVVGVALSVEIAYIHAQIASLGSNYTSFCNVNSSINCDRVLASEFSKLAGIPIAWFALATYTGLAGLFLLAWRGDSAAARRWLRLAVVGVAGSVAFSLYMLGVSLLVLETVCLMCSGLYLVVTVLAFLTVAACRAFAHESSESAPPLSLREAGAAAAASVIAVAAVAAASWPSVEALPAGFVDLEQVKQADPKFYDWYTSHEITRKPLLRAGDDTGSDSPPVTIVEFSDFGCGHCRRNHELISELVNRRPEQVRVVHRHFPLDSVCNEALPVSIHRNACRAAEAAECAGLQGRFSDMADILFKNQIQLFEENLFRLAAKIGLDEKDFRACMESNATLPRIIDDCRAGQDLDIKSTPTLYFNGRRVVGTFDRPAAYDFAVIIEAQLREGGDAS